MSTNYEVVSQKPMSNSEILEDINKKVEERELTYREEKTRSFLKDRTQHTSEEFKKIKEEIEALEIPRITEEHIVKIIDLMPEDGTQLRAITSHSGIVLVDENVSKLLDVLAPYRK